jgi:hypothetical protein
MEKFEIIAYERGVRTKAIECKDKGLIVMVVPAKNREGLIPLSQNDIELVANFYDKSLPAEKMWESRKELEFWVIDTNSHRSREWSRELFNAAIDFYCNQYIKIPHDGISVTWSLACEAFFDDDVIMDDDEPNYPRLSDIARN